MLGIVNEEALKQKLCRERSRLFPDDVVKIVKKVIADVEHSKDEAVEKYTREFDGIDSSIDIKVSRSELEKWATQVSKGEVEALKAAISNIRSFHMNQQDKSWNVATANGSILGNIITPIENVGVYVPGGTAAYPSSVIMNIVPAQIAGVKRISVFTPPSKDGSINKYVAAALCELGVYDVFRIGGAQAVAAAAFGTETVPKVDKIVGPGNIYVAAAKREVYGIIDIDMIAGPSEIVIIADSTARPDFIASDMLSQAEHDLRAKSILVTDSKELAELVIYELEKQLNILKRKEIAMESIYENGAVCLVKDVWKAVELVNFIAPEHLEIVAYNADELLKGIKNAGAIFIGEYSTEPIGDYIAGPNHVLPTSGTARFFSPLSVKDFQKMSSLIRYSKQDFVEYAPKAIMIAEAEGLTAHANAMKVRFESSE